MPQSSRRAPLVTAHEAKGTDHGFVKQTFRELETGARTGRRSEEFKIQQAVEELRLTNFSERVLVLWIMISICYKVVPRKKALSDPQERVFQQPVKGSYY